MHFDDRLATVLRQPVKGEAIARIQYRQLLDLLGTSPSGAQGAQVDAAFLRLDELSGTIPPDACAAMLADPSVRLRNPRLVAQLAQGQPQVAAAALAAARLGEEQWLDLIPALPLRARGLLHDRCDLGERVETLLRRLGVGARALPPAGEEPLLLKAEDAVEEDVASQSRERIGAIVRRIEEFRKSRQPLERETRPGDAPRLPFEEPAAEAAGARLDSFDFTTDAEGRIAWSDPVSAPMAVGLLLAARDPEAPVRSSPAFVAAWQRRQPVRGALLAIDAAPAIAGDWIADAAPRFDPKSGRFLGYCGRLRRPPAESPVDGAADTRESDRIRQVLHELRTPVNAIQGFAEVIQQQLFGPTPHEYRARAAAIAGDAAHILAGFEDLERLAKLDAGALQLEAGACDAAEVVARLASHLDAFLGPRDSALRLTRGPGEMRVALGRADAERLLWRLLATIAGAAAPGETLALAMEHADGRVRLDAQLPASLACRDDEGLFRAAPAAQAQALSAGMFGSGFALRLATSEARAAGGSLLRQGDWLRLELPSLTAAAERHSEQAVPASAPAGAS